MNIIFIIIFSLAIINCDKICENENGDLIYLRLPVLNYIVKEPRDSPVGELKQSLDVDNNNYTLQLSEDYKTGDVKDLQILYFKENFKTQDIVELNKKKLTDLITKNGFKDIKIRRVLGFQARKKGDSLKIKNKTCYYYQCDPAIKHEVCISGTQLRQILNNKSHEYYNNCTLASVSALPDYMIFNDGSISRFYGQCLMNMGEFVLNPFERWIFEAIKKNALPLIQVEENSVKFDWGKGATTFPKSMIRSSNITFIIVFS